MRKIKFRIIHEGQTYYWGYIEGGFAGIPASNRMPLELAKKLSCQFTGLHDKNGKEIFEGDVVEKDGLRGHITWRINGYWATEIGFKGAPKFDTWDEVEIIGNIFESKHLLNDNCESK